MKQTRLRIFGLFAIIFAQQATAWAQQDTTPPVLASLSFGAASINVSGGAATLTINATITDNLSGVALSPYIFFQSPTGQTVYGYLYKNSGTNLNGTYSGTATFPAGSGAGAWTAEAVLYDNAGNHSYLLSSNLISMGFPGTVTVFDTNPDTTPPTLLGAIFVPSTTNTSAGPTTVTVSLHVSDGQTGANYSQRGFFAVTMSPEGAGSNGPFEYIGSGAFSLVSGTPQNGVWQASKVMPQYSGGNWTITQVVLFDAVDNSIYLTSTQLSAMGISPVLVDTSSPADSTPPTLTGFSFTPSVADTSASAQNVTISLSAIDDISGVDFSPSTTNIAYFQLCFASPSGNQRVCVNPFIAPTLVGGTPLAGTWNLTATWPQYSEQGTWSVSIMFIKDKVGNQHTYTPAQLQALGFPSSIVITQPSLTPDGNIGSGGGTVMDSAFGARASVSFPAGLVSTTTSVSIDVFASALSVPTPRGFTMPGTYFENLSFTPALPSPVPSPGITVVLPLLNPMTPGAVLSLYHIDEVVGLAPAMNAFGQPVTGTVNSDGLSATFHNVVTFSTVVAYLSNGSTLGDVNGDGVVNCADVSILKSAFGTHTGQPGFNIAADLNNDGTVNILDLFIVSRQLAAGTVCQ